MYQVDSSQLQFEQFIFSQASKCFFVISLNRIRLYVFAMCNYMADAEIYRITKLSTCN